MDTIRNIFHSRLQEASNLSGVSQSEISRQLNVARNTVNKWFTGKTFPEPETIDLLASILNTSPQWLFGADETSPTRDAIISKITNEIHDLKSIEALEGVYMLIQRLKEEVADSQKKMTKEN